MSLKTVAAHILGLSNLELGSFVRQFHDQTFYEYFREEEGLTQQQMDTLAEDIVRQLMKRNLLIPTGGSALDLMALAENMHDDPEFGDKYKADFE